MAYLKSLTTGMLETNSFLVGAESSREAVLIDTPPESFDEIIDTLKKDGRRLAAVLITHPHFDHVMDVGKFISGGIPLVALQEAVGGIARPDAMGFLPETDSSILGAKVTRVVHSGDSLHFADLKFQVFEVPGHSIGSAAYYVKSESLCFVGDLIFRGSVGRSDLPGGNSDFLIESIHNCIYTLNDDTILLPGHGPSTDVGTEKRMNPFTKIQH